jgi:DNA-binding GntR family transcriptional regulator
LRVEERPATHEESDALEIEEGTEVIAIERLRTANEKPVVYTVDVIPSVSPELRTELHKLEGGGSLYDLLSDRTGLRVDHGVAALEPVAATAALATALNVPRRTPLLCLRQVDYAVGDQPALYSLEYHVAGAFRFTVYRDGPR